MKTLHTLYHLIRADFFERARHHNFLISIGLTIYVAYLYLQPSDADYLGFSLGGILGVYSLAWIRSIIAVLCSALLSLPGFYVFKDAITRDLRTRVGEIIAAAGLIMQLIRGEAMQIELRRYLAP